MASLWANGLVSTRQAHCGRPVLSGVKLCCLTCEHIVLFSCWHAACVLTAWCAHHDIRGLSTRTSWGFLY